MTDQTQQAERDTEAAVRIRAFLEARDRFATSARKQGVELHRPRLIDNIAQQPDTAAVVRFPGGLDVAERPGSASYPLNADDLRAVLAALDSAQERAAELQVELDSEGHQICLDWRKMRAERDEARSHIAELEDALRARAADELTHMDQWMKENDTLRKRLAELEAEREQGAVEWEPGRWYRVTQPNGDLWMETSDHEEAINAAHKTGWELTRLWRSENYEWRPTASDDGESRSETGGGTDA